MTIVWPLAKPYSPTAYTNQAGLDTAYVDPLNDLYARIQQPAICELSDTGGDTVANNADHAFASYNLGDTYLNDPLGVLSHSLGVITSTIGGRWRFDGTILWPTVAAGTQAHRRVLFVKKNGARLAYDQGTRTDLVDLAPSGGWAAQYQSAGGEFVMSAGDQVQMFAFQNSGATLTVAQATFNVRLVG